MAKKPSHQLLMEKHGVTVDELNDKTKKLLEKYAAATDEDDKETYNDKLFELIDDHIEAKTAKAREEEKNKKDTPAGKNEPGKPASKKVDVSKAGTATETPAKTMAAKKEESSFLSRRFGR